MSRTHLYLLLALFLSTQFTFITAQDDESSDEFSSTLVLSDELEGTDSIEDAEVSEAGDEAVDDDTPDTDSDSVDIESVDDTSTTSAAEEAEETEGTASAEDAAETEGTEAGDDDNTDSDSASSEDSIDDDMDDIDDTTTLEPRGDIAMDAFEEGSAEENALDEGLASDGRNSGGLVSGKDAQNGTVDSKGVWIAIGSVIGLLVAFVGCGGYWFYNKSKWNGTKSTMDKIANLEMEVCIDQPRVSEGADGCTPVSDKTAMPSTKYGEVEQEVDDEDINDPLR